MAPRKGPRTRAASPVSHPSHYTAGKIECKDAIASAITNLTGIEAHFTGCCLKYLWRWKGKNAVEDLKKCRQYLDWLIEMQE